MGSQIQSILIIYVIPLMQCSRKAIGTENRSWLRRCWGRIDKQHREAYPDCSGHQMTTRLLTTHTICTTEDAQGNYTFIQKCVGAHHSGDLNPSPWARNLAWWLNACPRNIRPWFLFPEPQIISFIVPKIVTSSLVLLSAPPFLSAIFWGRVFLLLFTIIDSMYMTRSRHSIPAC